jgi:hypothetical protein
LKGDATQTRANLRQPAIDEYAEMVRDGEPLDPAVVYRDGDNYFLAAGFHRREAYRLAGKSEMPCMVKEGSKWAAIEAGIQDNRQHRGERLTLGDRRHNARLVLQMQPQLLDRQIADLVTLSHVTVGKYRGKLEATGQIDQLEKRSGRDGKERRQPVPKGVRTGQLATEQMPAEADDGTYDAAHCGCGGEWVSDGHGQRYCEECKELHPWDKFPLPAELAGNHAYSAPGQCVDMARIDMFPDGKYCFVSIATDLFSGNPQIFGDMRGRRADRQDIISFLQNEGFAPSMPWQVGPHRAFPPTYIPGYEERWELEGANRRLHALTGRFPWQ